MAGMSVKGPYVRNSEEAEALVCRKAVIFAMEAGFSELVVKGDNVTLMRAISDLSCHNSLLGHIYEDICCYLSGMQHASVSCIERGAGNMVAHSLARYAKNIRVLFSYFPILDLLISDQINFYLEYYLV